MAVILRPDRFLSSPSTRPYFFHHSKPSKTPPFRPDKIDPTGTPHLTSNTHNNRLQASVTHKDVTFSADSPAKVGMVFPKPMKWWEKGIQLNRKEIESANDFVDSLLSAADRLVVVYFFSPGCAGCKALHPKVCQFAEKNPYVLFLKINYEEHKSMCYSLNVHVLPFFRFYRGAQGRLCSFSCTNATIKKFKDALAKHTPDRCSIGQTMGLEKKELLALAANKDLNFTYTPRTHPVVEKVPIMAELPLPAASRPGLESGENVLVATG